MAKIILQATAIAVVVFVLAATSLTLWRSFHPTNPPNEAHGSQSSETKDNHGKEDKGLLDRTTENPVAFFTLWLTLFTGRMALSTKDLRDFAEEQARDMKESIAVNRIAANSARDAANAANASTRIAAKQFEAGFKPWLLAKISGPYIDESRYPLTIFKDGEPNRWTAIEATIEIGNFGEMPATIVKSHVDVLSKTYHVGSNYDENVFEILGKGDKFFPRQDRQIKGAHAEPAEIGSFFLTPENRQTFKAPHRPPIVGRIEYLDPLGKRREIGFAFEPNSWGTSLTFSRWGGEQYNYDREINE